MREGTLRISGPLTHEEKELLDSWHARVPEIQMALDDLRSVLEHEDDPNERADIEKHIIMGERMLNGMQGV